MTTAILAEPGPTSTGHCLHCGTDVATGERFCCVGCGAVHRLLNDSGLARYYDLRGDSGTPVTVSPTRDLKWLDAMESSLAASKGCTRVEFDVQGMRCAACVWLLEELFTRQAGGLDVVVNPGVGRVSARVLPEFALREYVRAIERFGYLLGPARKATAPRSEATLGRIGVCVALSMNAMLFSLPVYLGLRAGLVYNVFRWASFAIACASVAVGGSVFLKGAWEGLRRRVLHLDVPIALGIVLSFAGSTWAFVSGRDSGTYYDTVATFIALMLVGRWLQERVLEKNRAMLLASDGSDALLTRRVRDGRVETLACRELEAGDALLVAPGDLIPVDAVLDDLRADCSLDWINGESTPREFLRGETVPAGAFNAGVSALSMTAATDFADSPLPGLLRAAPRGTDQARATSWWQKFTRIYVVGVLIAAAAGFALWAFGFGDLPRAMEVATAILVVTCPCAFGLATPMAYELVQAALGRAGLFVRSPSLLDRLLAVRQVVFDKTGTLTTGVLAVRSTEALLALSPDARRALYDIAARSTHPRSVAVRRALELGSVSLTPDLTVTETAGSGLSLDHDGHTYKLGRARWVSADASDDGFAFGVDGRVLVRIETEESLRPGARDEVHTLIERGYKVWILSGDTQERVTAMGEALGIPSERCVGAKSPEAKAEWLAAHDRGDTLMLGDGINDGLAVERAHCSGTPAIDRPFMPARTDFYMISAGLGPVALCLRAAARLAAVNRRNLTIALGYNGAMIAIAMMGAMSPLLCAIVMPLTSLSILLATIASLSPRSTQWKS